uniref:Uncharacterized protein n=1 Tax=Tanacetum cinerariifolium TaxID=118510 RepID=A0A699HH63_TANCI|nr:hypothetical protein [Tanacetum cinerariifolium]
MADPVICISDDSSEESVGTPLPMIISPDTVRPAVIPPIVPASSGYVSTSLDYFLGFDTETDPSKDPSSEHATTLPATSLVRKMLTARKTVRPLPSFPSYHSTSGHPSEHSSPSPPPRKRHRLQRCSPFESSDYVSPSPSSLAGPSRKRYIEADIVAEIVTATKDEVEAEAGDERDDEAKDDVESSARGTIEIGVDVVVETVVPDDIPRIADIEEHRDQEIRELADKREKTRLLDRVRVLEGDNMRLQGMLSVERERERDDNIQRRLGYVQDELRHICSSRYYDRMDFRRLETFATIRLRYRP